MSKAVIYIYGCSTWFPENLDVYRTLYYLLIMFDMICHRYNKARADIRLENRLGGLRYEQLSGRQRITHTHTHMRTLRLALANIDDWWFTAAFVHIVG